MRRPLSVVRIREVSGSWIGTFRGDAEFSYITKHIRGSRFGSKRCPTGWEFLTNKLYSVVTHFKANSAIGALR